MIEQTFTPESFTEYAFSQIRKAADESPEMAQLRCVALHKSMEVAKSSFEETNMTTSVPVIEAAQTDQTMSHQKALGSDRGGAIANPEDLGTDLTKALDDAIAQTKKALGVGDAGDDGRKTSKDNEGKDKVDKKEGDKDEEKGDKVVKGMGGPNKPFDELDNLDWPDDMSVGDVDATWGDDPE
jgi:hypothetical protein